IAVQRVTQEQQGALPETTRQDLTNDVAVDAHELDQGLEPRRIPFAIEVALGEADLAVGEEPTRKPVMADRALGLRPRLPAVQDDGPRVRQGDAQRSGADTRGRGEHLADEKRDVRRKMAAPFLLRGRRLATRSR